MKTRQRLIAEIQSFRPPRRGCALWWMGQISSIVKMGDTVLYLDPFVSEHHGRRIPPLLLPEDVTNADLILGTHDHADHIDRPAWPGFALASPRARFIVPELLRKKLAREIPLPLNRLTGLTDGQTVTLNGIRVTGIAAAHEFLDRDPKTGLYPHLGYVIEGPGITLFHAGDTCNYEGFQTRLSRWKLDLMILPINGRDAKRLRANCIGNMTYQEAVDLAGALKPRLVIPAHYDMFARNTEDPALFMDYLKIKYPAQKARICKAGQRLVLRK